MQTVLDLIPFSLNDCLVLVAAAVLPGMPRGVLMVFALLIAIFGWKFAICLSFGYYLLQFMISGSSAYD